MDKTKACTSIDNELKCEPSKMCNEKFAIYCDGDSPDLFIPQN